MYFKMIPDALDNADEFIFINVESNRIYNDNTGWSEYQFLISEDTYISKILFKGNLQGIPSNCSSDYGHLFLKNIEIIPVEYGNHAICEAGTVTLAPTCPDIINSGVDVNWSPINSTSLNPTVSVTQTTDYLGSFLVYEIPSQGIAVYHDISVNVEVYHSETINHTVQMCQGQTTTLCADVSYGSNHTWSNNLTTDCINITQLGTYTCETTNGACTLTEIFEVVEYEDATIYASIDKCDLQNPEWILEVQEGISNSGNCTYIWSNNDTQNPIIVTNPITYKVTITDNVTGCVQYASYQVPILTAFPFYNSSTGTCEVSTGTNVNLADMAYIVQGDINITNQSTLTLENCKLYMLAARSINIENGSHLNNYGSILSSCSTWKGVYVHGDPSYPYPNNRGYYTGKNNSIIEHAEKAIESKSGGRINIKDSHFINNLQSLYIHDHSINVSGIFLRNDMIVNDNKRFTDAEYCQQISSIQWVPKYQIEFLNIPSFTAFNCSIDNQTSNNAKIGGVLTNCPLRMGNITASPPRSSFENLYIGIRNLNDVSSTKKTELYDLDFVNCEKATFIESSESPRIERNTFDMGGSNLASSHGLFLSGCQSPEVKFNTFKNGARGLMITSGDGDYTVYKNTFENFTHAPGGDFDASAIVATGDNTITDEPNEGLQFKCNTFTNNNHSIFIRNGRVKEKQGFWDDDNPEVKDPANNCFSDYNNLGEDAFRVQNGTANHDYRYYQHSNAEMNITGYATQNASTWTFFENTGDFVTFEAACPDNPNSGGGGVIIGPGGLLSPSGFTSAGTSINTLNLDIDSKESELQTKVDKGNTNTLAVEVNTASPDNYTEVAQKVSDNEGYVSDVVLDEFITKDVGRPVAKTIALAQNSPLPEASKEKIEQAGLPEDLKSYLWAQQTGISVREQKEAEIDHLKSQKNYLFNALIASVLADSVDIRLDSLVDLLEQQNDFHLRKRAIQLMAAKGHKNDALQSISELRQDIVNLDNKEQLDDMLQMEALQIGTKGLTLAEQNTYLMQNRALLLEIYNKKDKASVKAYRMLKRLGENIAEPLDITTAFPLRSTEERETSSSINSSYKSGLNLDGFLSLYPNPVQGKLTVEYILAKGANTMLAIYDINGKLCLQELLKTNVGIKSINVEQLTSGIYILKLDSKSQEFIVK